MDSEYLNLLRLFHAEHVEYVVVGGYAVIAHGYPRTTGVIDILVRPTPANTLVAETAGVPVRYINLAALRKTKAATNRLQDR